MGSGLDVNVVRRSCVIPGEPDLVSDLREGRLSEDFFKHTANVIINWLPFQGSLFSTQWVRGGRGRK